MVASSPLTADCAKCCGLCCVAPAFDAEQGFGYGKPAHTPCANLRADDRCAIHHELRARGFPACAAFDCHGAGQRVTQLFAGQSWRSSPELARQMFTAYFRYRSLHELMFLLQLAIPKAAPPDATRLQDVIETIDDLCETGAALAGSVSIGELRREVLSQVRLAVALRVAGRPVERSLSGG
jgi:hypothetical protein